MQVTNKILIRNDHRLGTYEDTTISSRSIKQTYIAVSSNHSKSLPYMKLVDSVGIVDYKPCISLCMA